MLNCGVALILQQLTLRVESLHLTGSRPANDDDAMEEDLSLCWMCNDNEGPSLSPVPREDSTIDSTWPTTKSRSAVRKRWRLRRSIIGLIWWREGIEGARILTSCSSEKSWSVWAFLRNQSVGRKPYHLVSEWSGDTWSRWIQCWQWSSPPDRLSSWLYLGSKMSEKSDSPWLVFKRLSSWAEMQIGQRLEQTIRLKYENLMKKVVFLLGGPEI